MDDFLIGGNMDFLDELSWRGLVKDCTDIEGLREKLKSPVSAYCGFDPTADSLHVGHLQQIILLRRYQLAGHRPIALCGGATGMIGDPRPTTERKLLTVDEIAHNVDCVKNQLSAFLDFSEGKALLLNNYDWLGSINILDFLRIYGKHFNVNYMINKDTIASRLATGISYTEFTYTILQAMDWLHLYKNYQCELQIGGSDQWGNLVSGVDLIRKMGDGTDKVFGITSPLITKSDGSKFGKSEGGNVWLDPKKTSPYEFYQFWINIGDNDIVSLLKRLSFKSVDEINELEKSVAEQPHLRLAQKALANELCEIVHGKNGLESALRITETLFKGNLKVLSADEIRQGLHDVPSFVISDGDNIIDVLVAGKIASSKREARELIANGSIAVNGEKIVDSSLLLTKVDSLDGSLTIIKKGKKNYFKCEF